MGCFITLVYPKFQNKIFLFVKCSNVSTTNNFFSKEIRRYWRSRYILYVIRINGGMQREITYTGKCVFVKCSLENLFFYRQIYIPNCRVTALPKTNWFRMKCICTEKFIVILRFLSPSFHWKYSKI